jgi:hypothetical protein
MPENFNWSEFKPSKAMWFWSCVGCIVATLIVGFTWGGWVTGGTASEMALDAREDGRAELAAAICVAKFMDGSEAADRLAKLKEANAWQRDDVLNEGNWATLVGMEEPVEGAANLCASRLADMEAPPAANEAAAVETSTAVN